MTEQHERDTNQWPAESSGLFEGFERFATPTDDDYRSVMTNGLVVLDTNAVLNLYRYTAAVRELLLEVLSKLGGQLWEPHHVIHEFWTRRESAIGDYSHASRTFATDASRAREAAVSAIGALGNRIGLAAEQKAGLIKPIEDAFVTLNAEVRKLMDVDGASEAGRHTSTDPVILALEPLLRGRVGAPLESKAREQAMAEARRRIEAKEPPGYKDAAKRQNPEGDFLVWTQMLDEAKRLGRDVLFVTGDTKEDWWRHWGSIECAGPRFELLDEFHARTGRRLYMLRPGDLLAVARRVLAIDASEEEVEQARRVDRQADDFGDTDALPLADKEILSRLLGRVSERGTPVAEWSDLLDELDPRIRTEIYESSRERLNRLGYIVAGGPAQEQMIRLTSDGFVHAFSLTDDRAWEIRHSILDVATSGTGPRILGFDDFAKASGTTPMVVEQHLLALEHAGMIEITRTFGGALIVPRHS